MGRTNVLAAAVVTASGISLIAAVSAQAYSVSGSCSASGFTAAAGVYYSTYSSTYWQIDKTTYTLKPADSSSDLNNVNHTLFGGSASAKLASTGSADRDGSAHTLFVSGRTNYLARKGGSAYVIETVDFDRFGTDPHCTKRVYLP